MGRGYRELCWLSTAYSEPHVAAPYSRFPKINRVLLGRDPGTLKSDIVSKRISTINLFGFETLKLEIRRLKLWKLTVHCGAEDSMRPCRAARQLASAYHSAVEYIYIYIYTHYIQTYRHTDIQTYRHTYIHTYIQTDIHTYIYTYTYTYIYIHIHTYTYIYIHRYTYIHISAYIYVYVYIYIYIHVYVHLVASTAM